MPNFSEGRDAGTIAALAEALTADPSVRLLDVHSDPDHHRSVFTLAGGPGALARALLRGGRVAIERIDLTARDGGGHPHVGALDVAPVVHLDPAARGAACAEALVAADSLAEALALPVFLYGELSGEERGSQRTRAELRRGGLAGLAARMAGDEGGALAPDFGPGSMHPTAGATLVAARPPLVAFNVVLAPPATVADACRIASLVREGGPHGLPGLRAIGIALAGGTPQVSMNVERPSELPLARVVAAIGDHVEVAGAELVGLAPAAALEGFPADEVELSGFDPDRHVIENALGSG